VPPVDDDVHVFANGLRLYRSHLSPVQAARYRETNLHEPVEEEWFGRLLLAAGEAPRIADVGAGVGYYTILAKRLRPAAEVFAFEPLGEHHRRVPANLALNGIVTSGVRLFAAAVCDGVGTQPFHEQDFGSHLLPAGGAPTSLVATTTLGALLADVGGRLDLVKVDVQGDELRVIAGAAAVLDRIDAWLVGTHSPELHAACLAELEGRGYLIAFADVAPPRQPDGLIVAVAARGRR
jgi:FkbM family methyltransferase